MSHVEWFSGVRSCGALQSKSRMKSSAKSNGKDVGSELDLLKCTMVANTRSKKTKASKKQTRKTNRKEPQSAFFSPSHSRPISNRDPQAKAGTQTTTYSGNQSTTIIEVNVISHRSYFPRKINRVQGNSRCIRFRRGS